MLVQKGSGQVQRRGSFLSVRLSSHALSILAIVVTRKLSNCKARYIDHTYVGTDKYLHGLRLTAVTGSSLLWSISIVDNHQLHDTPYSTSVLLVNFLAQCVAATETAAATMPLLAQADHLVMVTSV